MTATPQRRKHRRSGFRWWYVVVPCAALFGMFVVAKGLKFDGETFGGPNRAGTVIVMTDGSTRVLSKDADIEVLRKMSAFKRRE